VTVRATTKEKNGELCATAGPGPVTRTTGILTQPIKGAGRQQTASHLTC